MVLAFCKKVLDGLFSFFFQHIFSMCLYVSSVFLYVFQGGFSMSF